MSENSSAEPLRLGPRFEWIAHLGRGGHGHVELAFDRERGARVALKFLAQRITRTKLLKHEFRVLRDLASRNLVAMLELVIEQDLECLVLEYVEGVDLLHHVRGPAPPTETREVTLTQGPGWAARAAPGDERGSTITAKDLAAPFLELIDALSYLERAGLVHGDLKPENVLVEHATERVVVLDFGIARLGREMPNRPIGTPIYMAPEQFRTDALTPSTDRYAVGVLLYRALSGRFPFLGVPAQLAIAKQSLPPQIGDSPLEAMAWRLLDPEPSRRPSLEELRAALAPTLRRPTIEADVPRVHTNPIIGRDAELAQLARATSADNPPIVLLLGGPGLGKTRLLDAFARGVGARVLRSRCYSNESVRWNAIDGLVDALVAEGVTVDSAQGRQGIAFEAEAALTRLFPVLRVNPSEPVTPVEFTLSELVRRAAQTLAKLLERQARVVVIDDVQWADADSRAFLVELLRLTPTLPVVLAARGPDGDATAFCSLLETTSRVVETLIVAPLSAADTQTLVSEMIGDQPLEADQVLSATGGVPYLIEELCHGLRKRDAAPIDWSAGGPLAAMRVSEQTDATVRRMLALLAVNDGPLALGLLSHVFGERAHAMLRGLVVDRLCRTDRSASDEPPRGSSFRVDVYHDQLRQRVLATMTDADRRGAHAELAVAAIATTPDDNDVIARHFLGAEDGRVYAYARRASEDARRVYAFDRALAWLHTLEAEPGLDAETRRELEFEIAECLRQGGHHADAAILLDRLAGERLDATALGTRRRAAEAWLMAGELARGIRDMREVAREYGLSGLETTNAGWALLKERTRLALRGLEPRRAGSLQGREVRMARLHSDTAWTMSGCLSLVDPIRAGLIHTRAVHASLDLGAPDQILRSLIGEVLFAGMFASLRTAHTTDLLRRLEVLTESLDPYSKHLASSGHGTAAVQAGHFAKGVPLLSVSLEALDHHPKSVGWELMTLRHFYLHGLYYLGRFRALRDYVDEEYRRSVQLKNRHRTSDVSLNNTIIGTLIARGVSESRRRAEEAGRFWKDVGANVQGYYLAVARSVIALWTGDPEAAWRVFFERNVLTPQLVGIEGLRVDAVHNLSRAASARAIHTRKSSHLSIAISLNVALAAELSPHAVPLAMVQLSGLARAFGLEDGSRRLARRASKSLSAQGMVGFAAAADALSERQVEASAMSMLGVGHEEQLLEVLVPGALGATARANLNHHE